MNNQNIVFFSTPHASEDSAFYKLYEKILKSEDSSRLRVMMSGRRTGKSWLKKQMNDMRVKGLRPDLIFIDELESGEMYDGRSDEFGRVLCIRTHVRHAIIQKREGQILFFFKRTFNDGIVIRVENCPSISPRYPREKRPCLCGHAGRSRESIVPLSYLSLEKGRIASE